MNVRIAQLVSFHAGSWFDDSLEMNEFSVKLWMITQTYSALEQNIAIGRLKHFIFDHLEHTIFVNSEEENKCREFNRVGLNVTSMPGDPADQLIGIMLFHKLNAIMEDRIKVVEIEIGQGSGIVYLHGENETSDDLIMPEWWTTADLTHCDIGLTDSDKVVAIPQNNAWRDLGLAWPEEPTEHPTGNIVVFADFKSTDESK
jgi:hypothetical protein